MKRKLKAWTALGAAMATSTAAVAATPFNHIDKQALVSQSHSFILAAGEGGEGGEGEGGAAHSDKMDHDAVYIKDLGLVAGHLMAGVTLYEIGETDQAKTHMKHPGDEIYEELEPEFKERGGSGFADELSVLAAAVEAGMAADEVRENLNTALSAILANEKLVGESGETAETYAKAIELLVREAAEEYEEGVTGGKVVEAHEYQDAWGFVQAARWVLETMPEGEKSEHAETFAEIGELLDGLDKAWPDLAGKYAVDEDASLLLSTAARIELAALNL